MCVSVPNVGAWEVGGFVGVGIVCSFNVCVLVLFLDSVTRFGEKSPLFLNFKSLWHYLKPSFRIGEIIEPT